MRKFLLIGLALMAVAVRAQKLEVVSFEEALRDNTAWNPATCRTLPDGRYCPLVKVVLNDSELVFEGNIIGDPPFKTNEYWVYMNVGAYHLIVKHPDFEKLDVVFEEINPDIKRLQQKHTYILTLHGKARKGLESVEKGEAAALLQMAQNYEQGAGAYQQDLQQAQIWYEKAAEAGSLVAQDYLAEVLYAGTKGFPRDADKALRWNLACAERGRTASYLALAVLYEQRGDREQQTVWLQKYNESADDAEQQYKLALLLGATEGEGLTWLGRAANNANPVAPACLLYARHLLPTQPAQAVPYYEKAVTLGSVEAMTEYGHYQYYGLNGIAKNEAAGQRLLEQAAAFGSSSAAETVSVFRAKAKADADLLALANEIPGLKQQARQGSADALVRLYLISVAMGDTLAADRWYIVMRYNFHTDEANQTVFMEPSQCEFVEKVFKAFDYRANKALSSLKNIAMYQFVRRHFISNAFTSRDAIYRQVIDALLAGGTASPLSAFTFNQKRFLIDMACMGYERSAMELLESDDVLTLFQQYDPFQQEFGMLHLSLSRPIKSQYEYRIARALLQWMDSHPDAVGEQAKTAKPLLQQAVEDAQVDMSADRFSSWLHEVKAEGYLK